VLSAIDRNWWNMANSFAIHALDNDIPISAAVKNNSLAKKKRIESLIATFDSKPTIATAAPAF
jgi:hypothetical protein